MQRRNDCVPFAKWIWAGQRQHVRPRGFERRPSLPGACRRRGAFHRRCQAPGRGKLRDWSSPPTAPLAALAAPAALMGWSPFMGSCAVDRLVHDSPFGHRDNPADCTHRNRPHISRSPLHPGWFQRRRDRVACILQSMAPEQPTELIDAPTGVPSSWRRTRPAETVGVELGRSSPPGADPNCSLHEGSPGTGKIRRPHDKRGPTDDRTIRRH